MYNKLLLNFQHGEWSKAQNNRPLFPLNNRGEQVFFGINYSFGFRKFCEQSNPCILF